MAPKKGQKMSLNAFLEDNSLGSWADEMDSLPSAPAARTDEDRSRNRGGDRDFGGRYDNEFSGRGDRQGQYPPRDELPLPTAPPYTAFIGNLAFDISDVDIEGFFQTKLKSVKLINDRDGKSRGFGYVEFEDLQSLKDALAKSGDQLASRTVRVSVAEPPKERAGFDDDKFGGTWRRDGPLPDRGSDRGGDRGPRGALPPSRYDDSTDRGDRMGFGSRFVPSSSGPERTPRATHTRLSDAPPGEADNSGDWRSDRPMRAPPPAERAGPPVRKQSGFTPRDGPAHPAETEEAWGKGSKFKPSETTPPTSAGPRKSEFFARRDSKPNEDEPNDWRSGPRRSPALPPTGRTGSFDRSPSESVPTTPQFNRRKLDMAPRSTSQSTATSPVGSPKASNMAPVIRANPFGAAKPIDVASKEKEIEEKLAREREARQTEEQNKAGRPPVSNSQERKGDFGRDFSRAAPNTGTGGGSWRERDPSGGKPRAPVSSQGVSSKTHSRASSAETNQSPITPGTKFRPQFSFASVAAASGGTIQVAEGEEDDDDETTGSKGEGVNEVEKKISEVSI